MLASSSTFSRVESSSSSNSNSNVHKASSQLLLRGTRDGDLTATLLSSSSSSASRSHTTGGSTSRSSERAPLFTWADLTAIVSRGNLQLLARHPDDVRDYFAWMDSIKSTYGSVTAFLLSERFTATKLLEKASSSSSGSAPLRAEGGQQRCFQSSFQPGRECQILVNDWPYSVPAQVTHQVVWSYLPILHRDLVASQHVDEPIATAAWSIIAKRGLCGTLTRTGLTIPTVKDHAAHLPDLLSPLAATPDAEAELQKTLEKACVQLVRFIELHWDLAANEVAFFANPPSLQSVPSLAHFHVLVKAV